MKMTMVAIPIVVICLISAGCGTAMDYEMRRSSTMKEAQRNNANLYKLSIGMTKEQAIKIMGTPNKVEAYNGVEYLLYRTEGSDRDLQDSDSSFMPVAIINGKVGGWGRNYYQERSKKIEADISIDTN